MPLEKKVFSLIFVLCAGALGTALVSQHLFGLMPCAWCVMQRLIYLVIGIVAASFAFTPYKKWPVAIGSITLIALSFSGIAAAWYQTHYAAKAFSCNLGFADKFMINTGLDAALPSVFGIFASCADAVVNIMGLDYSNWSLLLFGLLGSLSTINVVRSLRAE